MFRASFDSKLRAVFRNFCLSSQPALTQEAADRIAQEYSDLRDQDTTGTDQHKVI